VVQVEGFTERKLTTLGVGITGDVEAVHGAAGAGLKERLDTDSPLLGTAPSDLRYKEGTEMDSTTTAGTGRSVAARDRPYSTNLPKVGHVMMHGNGLR
jgi:hypothetical protein